MTGGLRWTVGLGASILAHVVAALSLPQLVDPQPLPDQPLPRTQMQVETQEVARSEAEALPQDAEALPEAAAAATRLDSGAVPQSRSDGIVPEAAALAAAPVTQRPTLPTEAEAPPLAAAVAPVRPLPPQQAEAAIVMASAPASRRAVISTPAVAALAASPPVQTAAAPLAPGGADAPPADLPAALPATRLETRPAPGDTVAAVQPDTTRATAALAWSGDQEIRIDPQSLAAIQSFMLPGDAARQGTEVRDALTDLLAAVPCARLQAVFDPATGSLGLRGHIPEDGLRMPILDALQAQVGGGIPVRDEMLILPRPQCGALSGIAAVGLPQSTDQDTNPLLVGEDAHARAYDYRQGERLIFDLAAPDYDAVIYVDYFDADGQVIHLTPNEVVPLREHPAQSAFRVGAGEDGLPFLDITIGPPYGQEIAAAFAASTPLYDGVRPMVEPAAPYLEWLGERVAAARAADPGFRGEWVYFFVTTTAE